MYLSIEIRVGAYDSPYLLSKALPNRDRIQADHVEAVQPRALDVGGNQQRLSEMIDEDADRVLHSSFLELLVQRVTLLAQRQRQRLSRGVILAFELAKSATLQ